MNKNVICVVLSALLFTFSSPAAAQQQAKVPKIGLLRVRLAASGTSLDILIRELRGLGYEQGKNIMFESRSAENKLDRLPALADELVRLKVDVLVTAAVNEARAAKNATKTIPIIFVTTTDPVAAGLVESLARPGGNITGFTSISPMLAGKRLELLKEIIPKLSRVAVLWDPQSPGSTDEWKESQVAARELDLHLHSMEVSSGDKLDNAFKEAIKARSAALAVIQSAFVNSYQKQITDLANKNRLPAVYNRRDFVDSGGLMSYAADRFEPYRRIASMVDKILKARSRLTYLLSGR